MTADDKLRYSRNILLPGFGQERQERLAGSSVLVVGCGALGSVAGMYLAASGVGRIGLVDFDTIDVSNLQRQLSFTVDDIGLHKAPALGRRIKAINPGVKVEVYDDMLRAERAVELVSLYDLILEGSDNPATKYMVTDACTAVGRPCVLGGVAQYAGQVMSFLPGSVTYRDIFPEATPKGGYMPCSVGGVLGPLPGIIGSMQAVEAIKILASVGTPLVGRLFVIDALTMKTSTIDL